MTGRQCLALTVLLVVCAIILVLWNKFLIFVSNYWWKPFVMRRLLMKQGVDGPPPSFMVGNMHEMTEMRNKVAETDMEVGNHNIMSRVCPYYCEWAKKYGKRLVFWWGIEPRITVSEPEIIKQILATKAGHFGKSALQQKGGAALLGNGLIMANGEDWAHRRRIVSRAFQLEKLKGMVPSMVQSTNEVLEKWDAVIRMNGGENAEIDVYEQFALVTADVIARTSFGSSFEQGKQVFQLLRSLQKVFVESNRFVWLPGSRFLPTATNRKVSALKKAMARSLEDIVDARRRSVGNNADAASYGNDLLGLMLAASAGTPSKDTTKSFKFSTEELIEECKTFYFVGHETTLILLTWTMMLLALNPEWQEKARTEVQESFKGRSELDVDMLSKLKTVTMVLNESLRLYPPAPVLVREAFKDMTLGDMFVPKGCTFWMPILAIHHDSQLWGPDSMEFKPERFAEGISKACKRPNDFMPFSFGPRACVGQTFAMMEAKTVLAMVLLRYKFCLSSSYRHAPVTSITIKPKHGMPLIVERI